MDSTTHLDGVNVCQCKGDECKLFAREFVGSVSHNDGIVGQLSREKYVGKGNQPNVSGILGRVKDGVSQTLDGLSGVALDPPVQGGDGTDDPGVGL